MVAVVRSRTCHSVDRRPSGRLARILRHLIRKGLFAEPAPGQFALNAAARGLLDSSVRLGFDLDGIAPPSATWIGSTPNASTPSWWRLRPIARSPITPSGSNTRRMATMSAPLRLMTGAGAWRAHGPACSLPWRPEHRRMTRCLLPQCKVTVAASYLHFQYRIALASILNSPRFCQR
jgi:hypothetical protein